MSSPNWMCTRIIKKFKSVSDTELKQRLDELWDVLVQDKSQFPCSQVLIPVKSKTHLLTSKRRDR